MSYKELSRSTATILILCSACSVASYALNPTGRYLVEMSRLIRDPQLQRSSMNSVAAPLRPEETEPAMVEDEEFDDDAFHKMRSNSVFDGAVPTQARRKMLEVAMETIDDSSDETGYDLFDALDRHLRALDEQIETSSSLSSALDEELSSVEMEYDGSEADVLERGDMSYAQAEPAFFEDPTDFEIHPSDSAIGGDVIEMNDESVQTQAGFTCYQGPVDETQHPEPTEYVETKSNAAVLIRSNQEELIDFEAQRTMANDDQRRNNPHIIGTDSFGFSTIHSEATHSFEEYRPARSKCVAIQHLNGPPPLPDTTDPYELLGFGYHNPPKDADDIRRAYVQRAKKYHPDALHPASSEEERELATRNFKRINDAYRKLKNEKFRLQDEFFATTMGGAMYEPRGSGRHIRRPFSYGNDFDESESLFSGSYSARHGARYGGTRFWEKRKAYDDYQKKEQRPNSRETRNPFRRRHEVRQNCHVSGQQFPPF